jgi:hypothetical protein
MGRHAARRRHGLVRGARPEARGRSGLLRPLTGQVLAFGPGTAGTLTYCAGAAYYVRDPQTDKDPARLVRVTPDGRTAIVHESTGVGNAFLSTPRCGGDAITLTSYGDEGDEQVTADLG